MAQKKSMWGLGSTLIAAVTGAVAGAVGMFLSDEDNRKKVGKEIKRVEHDVEEGFEKVKKSVKKVAKKKKAGKKRR